MRLKTNNAKANSIPKGETKVFHQPELMHPLQWIPFKRDAPQATPATKSLKR
jgi:hypothetical protein